MRRRALLLLALLAGCDGDGAAPAGDLGQAIFDAGLASTDGATAADLAASVDAGDWHSSLSVCWTDPACRRALLVSHGGDWDATLPYDSRGAFHRAYDKGADGIKTDFLVSADNVGIVAHSSPILIYESLECVGKKIEEMAAADVTACHLAASTTETYQRVDEVMEWARGKVILMLTVKDNSAFARAISTALEHHAEGYTFIEVKFGTYLQVIPGLPDWDKLHYNIEVGSTQDVDTLLAGNDPAHAFSYETAPTLPGLDTGQMTALIQSRLHPAGVRSFAATDQYLATVQNHLDLFNEGFDVVMSYNLSNGVQARTQINTARGVSPP